MNEAISYNFVHRNHLLEAIGDSFSFNNHEFVITMLFSLNFVEIMQEAVQFMSEMTTPFYAWFAGALVIVIDHPDDVHTVLTSKSCMEKSSVYKFFNMGTSLFTAPGELLKESNVFLVTKTFYMAKFHFFTEMSTFSRKCPLFLGNAHYSTKMFISNENFGFFG